MTTIIKELRRVGAFVYPQYMNGFAHRVSSGTSEFFNEEGHVTHLDRNYDSSKRQNGGKYESH